MFKPVRHTWGPQTETMDRHTPIFFENCSVLKLECGRAWIARGVVPGGAMTPPDFGRSVNSISTRGDSLCPPNYYWNPWIFRPSDGPELPMHYFGESESNWGVVVLVWIGSLNNKRIYRNARYHHDTNTRITPTYGTSKLDTQN